MTSKTEGVAKEYADPGVVAKALRDLGIENFVSGLSRTGSHEQLPTMRVSVSKKTGLPTHLGFARGFDQEKPSDVEYTVLMSYGQILGALGGVQAESEGEAVPEEIVNNLKAAAEILNQAKPLAA